MLSKMRGIKTRHILLFAVSSLAYYLLIMYLIAYQSEGLVLITVPRYIIYAAALSGGFLFSVSFLHILKRRRSYGAGVPISTAGTCLTGVIVGCGCSAPIMFGLVGGILGGSTAVYAIDFVSAYSTYIILIVVAAEMLIGLYYVYLLESNSVCTPKREKSG